MSAVVVTAGLLAVISLSVALVQINSQNQCHLCENIDKVSRGKNNIVKLATSYRANYYLQLCVCVCVFYPVCIYTICAHSRADCND